jgi:predicted GIY-YIG superfamily endonuclease
MSSIVYWLHNSDHTDMFTQGYIGVTNNLNVRLRNHKSKRCNKHLVNAMNKYGWDNIVKEVMLVADESYCLMIEKLLRAKANIGWNIVEGGGKPPVNRWNKGLPMHPNAFKAIMKANIGRIQPEEEKAKRAKSMLGHKVSEHNRERFRQLGLTQVPPMKGKHFPKVKCPHCDKEGGLTGMKSWHFDNCRLKGIDNGTD